MTVLDRAEVILDADDRLLLAGSRRGGVAMVALGNIAANATEGLVRGMVAGGRATIRAAIDMERLQKGLEVTAGSGEAFNRQMRQAEKIARLPGLGFRETIDGLTQLNVALEDTDRSSRTLQAFGRAVALTGGGAPELQRVITQVTQIASAGKLLTQDLRPIIQTAPAVGQALKDAFGTISPQEIEALGLSTDEFLNELVGALEDLPAPVATADNALENLKDSAFRAGAELGEVFLPAITVGATGLADQLERAADGLDRMKTSGMDPGLRGLFTTFLRPSGGVTKSPPQRTRRTMGDEGTDSGPTAEELLRLAEAERIAALEAQQFGEHLEFLHGLIRDMPEPTLEFGRSTVFLTGGLEKLDLSVFELWQSTNLLGQGFDMEGQKAMATAIALGQLTDAQNRLNDAKRKGAALFGGLGALQGALGIALPGLGLASGLFGAFNSFSGLFADGGSIDAGHWGIVGEAGPEIVTGPAEVTPMGSGVPMIDLARMPAAMNPLAAARDSEWLRFFHETGLVLEANGA